MATLRVAHRVLSLARRRLGLGIPGIGGGPLGGVAAIALFAFATAAEAQQTTLPPASLESILFATLKPMSGSIASSTAETPTTVVLGTNAVASSAEAVAIGTNVTASGGKAVSIGSGNVASGNGAVAIGDPNTATGTGALAMGADNTATGNGAVALGNLNMAGGGGQAIGVVGTAAQGAVGMGYQNTVIGQGAVAVGDRSVANGGSAVAMGRQANATGLSAVAIGQTSAASNIYAVAIGGLASATGAESVAMGTGAQGATSMSVAIGSNAAAQTNAGDVALGAGSATSAVVNTTGDVIDGVNYSYAGTSASSTVSVGQTGAERTVTNVAAGRVSASSTDAVNGSQLFATNQAVETVSGRVTTLGGDVATYLGGGATYDSATGSLTAPSYTVQGGTYNNVGDALGAADTALTNNTTDIAALQTDALQWNTTLGAYDASHGSGSPQTIANVAAGVNANDAVNVSQLSQTVDAARTHYYSVGDGGTAKANYNNDGAAGLGSIAAGVSATAHGLDAIAIGSAAVTASNAAVSIGSNAGSGAPNTTYNVSIGYGAGHDVQGTENVAVGPKDAGALVVGRYNSSFGQSSNYGVQGSYNSSFGVFSGRYSIGSSNTFLGAYAGYASVGNSNVAIGDTAGEGVTGDNNIVLGFAAGNHITASDAISIGTYTIAGAAKAIALGYSAVGTGVNAVAIGTNAQATNTGSIALGVNTQSSGPDTIAIGTGAMASNSVALGAGASAGAGGTALGDGANAILSGGVALGKNSVEGTASPTTGTTINGTTYLFSGTAPTSVVSVGNLGAERQITNVAAGRISGTSTDAINGSQLFATNQAVTSLSGQLTHYYSVNDGGVLGGNYANDGATGQYALAAGVDATAVGIDATAAGHLASATGAWSVALGRGANAAYSQGVAIGKQAQTQVMDAVAIGSDAYAASNVGDVALGARSYTSPVVNTTGTTINGVAYTFAGTATSTVSVGQPGLGRTITNVAAGRVSATSTDAINGSQLFASNQAIESLATDALRWNTTLGAYDASHGSGSPQTIANVAAGVNANDAVNVSQLSQTVGAARTHYYSVNDGGVQGGNYNNDGATGTNAVAVGVNAAAAGVDGTAIGNGASASGEGAIALGRNTVSSGLDTIAIGTGAVATNSVALGAGASAGAGGTALGDGAKATTAGGVALGKNSVEGTANATASTTINGTTYNFAGTAPTSVVSVGSAGAERQITNVASGQLTATSTDAVNGSQLFATNQAVEAIGTQVGEVNDRAVKYDGNVGDPKDSITLEGTTGTKITNLTAGAVNALSTDAINGSQLYGVSNSIASHLGGGASVNADGTVSGPTYTMQGGSYTTVYDTFAAVDGSLTSINNQLTSINNGAGVKYFHANSSAADSQAVGQESVAVGPTAVANGASSVAMGNGATTATGATGAVALGQGATANNTGDVALGSGSMTQAVVNTTGTTINGTNYTFAGTAATSTVSVGGVGAERTITNVAAGRLSASSTDAVNGSQLFATNQAIDGLAAGIGGLTDGAVLYDKNPDGTKKNSVALIGGNPNAPVLISNVQAGVATTDAVNVGQLKDGLSNTLISANTYTDTRVTYALDAANAYTDQVAVSTLSQANDYTDYKFGQLNKDIGEVRSEARQAAAIGLAAASLRYDDRPGKLSAAVGGGIWRGEGALAFGAGYTSESGRLRSNISATTAGGNWGAGAGLSYTFN